MFIEKNIFLWKVENDLKEIVYLIATGWTNGERCGNWIPPKLPKGPPKPPGGGFNKGNGRAGRAVILNFFLSH